MMDKVVINLKDIDKSQIDLVGGKGASLGELLNAGFNVPGGFCLTTAAYRKIIEINSGVIKLLEKLNKVESDDHKQIKELAAKIREVIENSTIPDDLEDSIINELESIGEKKYFAVRSSATAEDLPTASFAGQQDTFLNISGAGNIITHIKMCWASLFTERAIIYRVNNGFKHEDVFISVVIQEMVDSNKSGTLFTVDPLTENRKLINIEAIFGLGEELVSGKINPDKYIINRESREIFKSSGTTLNPFQINQLCETGLNIERHYNCPQDIEWAIYNDELYILQSRPITTLFPIDGLKSRGKASQVYFSLGHQQNMTEMISPLGISTMKTIIPFAKDSNKESSILKENSGFIFINLSKLLKHRILKIRVLKSISMLNPMAPLILTEAMKEQSFKYNRAYKVKPLDLIKVLGVLFKVINRLFFKKYNGLLDRVNGSISDYIKRCEEDLDKAGDKIELIEIARESLYRIHGLIPIWLPEMIAGMVAIKMLGKMGKNILTDREINNISLGLKGNVVKDMNLKLGDLADMVKASPELTSKFNNLDESSTNFMNKLKDVNGGDQFINAFNNYLDEYGARGICEIDIMRPKWYEDPISLLRVIKSHLNQESGYHRKLEDEQIKERVRVSEKLINNSRGIKKLIIKRLIYTMIHCGIFREHHKFAVIRLFRPIKKHLIELSESFENRDDIWFLHWYELENIFKENNPQYLELIKNRKSIYRRNQGLKPPMVITSDGEIPQIEVDDNIPENCLKGFPVSPGIYEGIVRVVNNPESETLEKGEVLVTTFTDPGWTSLFMNAGALLMEVGGVMTHGSVVAREYQIPAIVGVKNVIHMLKTGDRVRVDAYTGLVHKLSFTT